MIFNSHCGEIGEIADNSIEADSKFKKLPKVIATLIDQLRQSLTI